MKTRECPNCGYHITEIEFQQARFDYPCPQCGDDYTGRVYNSISRYKQKETNNENN